MEAGGVTGAPAVRCRRCRAVLGYAEGRELRLVTLEGKRLRIKPGAEVGCECGLWRRWAAPAKGETAEKRV
jgi:hypothetical protein